MSLAEHATSVNPGARSDSPAATAVWWTMAAALLGFVPLAALVLWLSASERMLSVSVVWNDRQQKVCVRDQACEQGLVAIEVPGQRVSIDADLLLDAGHFLPTHERRQTYSERHRDLNRLLRHTGHAHLVWADGHRQAVSVQARGLAGTSVMLWLHVLLAGVVWVSGWTHARLKADTGSLFLALASAAYACGMVLGGLELDHGLAWGFGAAGPVNQAARTSVQLAFAFFLAFVLCLPRSTLPLRAVWGLPLVALTIGGVDFFALAPAPFWGHQAFMVLWCAWIPLAMLHQWRHTHSPLLLALAQWFGLGALLLLLRFVAIRWFADANLGEREFFVAASFIAVKVFSAVVMLVIPVLGWARPVLRRLFLWVLAAGLVLVADVFMVLGLSLNTEVALLASVLLIGAAYVPLRTWTFSALLGHRPVQLEGHIEALYGTARSASLSPDKALDAWRDWLQAVFASEKTSVDIRPENQACLLEQGAALWAPLPPLTHGVVLWHARGGRHLFDESDRRFVVQCANLIGRLMESDRAAELARLRERERIASDLHDELGGRLLHLARSGPVGPWRDYAQNTLAEMRLIAHGISRGPTHLPELMADLRAEFVPRIQACARQARWEAHWHPACQHFSLSPEAALALVRVVSEGVRNALNTPASRFVGVHVTVQDGMFRLGIENDGVTTEPATWRPGLGMRSIERRAQQLGGSADWQTKSGGDVVLSVSLPLAQMGSWT